MAMLRSEREHQRWVAERKDKKKAEWETRKAIQNDPIKTAKASTDSPELLARRQQAFERNKFNESNWQAQDIARMQGESNLAVAKRNQLGETRRNAMKYGFENRKLNIEQNKNRDALFNSLFNKASGLNEKGEPIGELVTGEARNKAFSNLKDQYEAFGQQTMGASNYWMPGSPQQQAQSMGRQQPIMQPGAVNAMGSRPQQLMRAPSMQKGRGMINGVPEEQAMADFEARFGKNGNLSSLKGDVRKAAGVNWLGDRGGLQGRVQENNVKPQDGQAEVRNYVEKLKEPYGETTPTKKQKLLREKKPNSDNYKMTKTPSPGNKAVTYTDEAKKKIRERMSQLTSASHTKGQKVPTKFKYSDSPPGTEQFKQDMTKPATTTKAFEKNLSKLRNEYPGLNKKELLKIFQRNNK